jgi:hypothetical protein
MCNKGKGRAMNNREPNQILATYGEEKLSKLHFFRIVNNTPIATFLEHSQMFEENDLLREFLELGLLHEHKPSPSFIFYRERMEDFVFVKCEIEISRCEKKNQLKQEVLANTKDSAQNEKYKLYIERFQKYIAELKNLKEAFTIMFRYSAKNPSNERYADKDGISRRAALKILSSFNIKNHSMLDRPDLAQGERYFSLLERKGFWKEFAPELCYSLTDLGIEVVNLLRLKTINQQSPEEEDFEKLVQDLNRFTQK